jgi:hypothetical protein
VIEQVILLTAAVQIVFLVVFKFFSFCVLFLDLLIGWQTEVSFFLDLLIAWQTEVEVHDLYAFTHALDFFDKQ